ncbi:MAG: 30S ribosomal protein S16 [Bacteroidetes bacterium]|nr:30S ribosomal protein S16 [Bacteroidota bacterium]MBU1373929.1 30S ribosomal protein S16 [Bacteroidota bacterium]MBU1485534.1 30S ribosomal protein S16 [Bacteroidota bacterium]MBU1761849.1 30S ribosomal protein S16 [Bacteroidota bacterium]MBU2046119.1 30S ribosomal protein S16 [Bacteroidota bacterium]
MATKIRLQRHGKKGRPFYYIVVADARSPRDGKFIERLGSYNPNTNPATIDLNFDKAVDWVSTGATPTDTAKAILSYKGVLYKNHLNGGVTKGALTQEQAEAKFTAWLESKDGKIQSKKDGLLTKKDADKKASLEAETKKKEEMAAALEAKNAPVIEEEEVTAEAEVTEEPTAEVEVAEVPAAETEVTTEKVVKEPAADAEEKTPAAE